MASGSSPRASTTSVADASMMPVILPPVWPRAASPVILSPVWMGAVCPGIISPLWTRDRISAVISPVWTRIMARRLNWKVPIINEIREWVIDQIVSECIYEAPIVFQWNIETMQSINHAVRKSVNPCKERCSCDEWDYTRTYTHKKVWWKFYKWEKWSGKTNNA